MFWSLVTTYFWLLLLATTSVLAQRNVTLQENDRRVTYTPSDQWRREALSGSTDGRGFLCFGDVDATASMSISGVTRIRMNYHVSDDNDRPISIRFNDEEVNFNAAARASSFTRSDLDVGTTYTVRLIKQTEAGEGWIAIDSFVITVPDDSTIAPAPTTATTSVREGTLTLSNSTTSTASNTSSIYVHRTTKSRTRTDFSLPEYTSRTTSGTDSPTDPAALGGAPQTLEAGTIAGIAIGCTVGTVFLLVAIFFLYKKKRERDAEKGEKMLAEKQLADLNHLAAGAAVVGAGRTGRQSPVLSQYGFAYQPSLISTPGPNKMLNIWPEEEKDPHATLTSPPSYLGPPTRQSSKRSHYLRHSELNPRGPLSPTLFAAGAGRTPATLREDDGERTVITPSPMWTDSVASNHTAVDPRTGIKSYYSEKEGMYVYGFADGKDYDDGYGGIGSDQGHQRERTAVERDSPPMSPTDPLVPQSGNSPGWISPTTGHDYGQPAPGPRFKMSRYDQEENR